MPNATITLSELIKAVNRLDRATHGPIVFDEYWTHESFARALFNHADTTGGNIVKDLTDTKNADATLTVAELQQALSEAGATRLNANELYNKVLVNREDFNPGDIVESHAGTVFQLLDDSTWLKFNETYSNRVNYKTPVRPLKLIGRGV